MSTSELLALTSESDAAREQDRKRISALEGMLEACLEYFELMSDVRDGDYGEPDANKEMLMAMAIKELLEP